jgi:hypothetical protein
MGLKPNNPQFDPTIGLALTMASICSGLNCLPRSGGVLDQEAYTMEWLLHCIEAQEKVRDLKKK